MNSNFRKFQIMSACIGLAACIGQPVFSQNASDFNEYSESFDMSGASASAAVNNNDPAPGTSGATGEQSHDTIVQYAQPPQQGNYAVPQLEQACSGNLAGRSVNRLFVPSGQYSFGFTGGSLKSLFSKGGYLPQTSTSSVDLNITE